MPELETTLRRLGAELAFPATPDLAAAVEARIGAPPPRRTFRWRLPIGRQLAIALAILVAAFGAVLAASPGARSAFLELFGIKGATVSRVERVPDVDEYAPLQLGEPVSLPEARRAVAFRIRVPDAGDGQIERVFLRRDLPGGVVSFVFCCPRLVLIEFRGETVPFVEKFAGPQARVEHLLVGDAPGVWIEGAHAVVFRDASGVVRDENLRLAGNVLLWELGGITYRLEGPLTRERALEIASGLR
jgi:hypothetical protein